MDQGISKHSKKHGLPPGSLIYTGNHRDLKPEITLFHYDNNNFTESEIKKQDIDTLSFSSVSWLNVNGLEDISLIENIGKRFSLHPLVMEDILSINQRPKVEFYEHYIFIVLKMIYYCEDNSITSEQVSIILTQDCVISFQEKPGDVFDPIRERIRMAKGMIRRKDSDYLCYSLIDAITDNYFSVMEGIGEYLEALEEIIIRNPTKNSMSKIHHTKRQLSQLRKSVWPLREVCSNIEKSESILIKRESKPYFRDVYDHSIQIMDTVESQRELLSGLLDIYLSSLSNRMNEVMKVLTIIATIFIPLTFITGVYGMNFHFMPELGYKWAYPASLGLMIIIGVGMVIYFKRKKWL